MNRFYYSDNITDFLNTEDEKIIGKISIANEFPLELTQRDAWLQEILLLKIALEGVEGRIYFEYSIPRMGKRIDVILLINPVIFVLEFKIGDKEYNSAAIDQVWDYALDLKYFHETSHYPYIAPILIATEAKDNISIIGVEADKDKLLFPIMCNKKLLGDMLRKVINFCGNENLNINGWEQGSYCPTPTIIEAAMALYNGHSVKDISRSDAGAKNLKETSDEISRIIKISKENSQKSICFVTGVPGAGKTLVGLNIATLHINRENELYSVFLSGNGPLVDILREALARDKVFTESKKGKKLKLTESRREVKMFIQNVHNFRDECLVDIERAPIEHVALFDEAQRAWDLQQTANFMKRKKSTPGFKLSEPEFLISCLNRHQDWAVIVCLVGGGQEINTGEAGISEWIAALNRSYPDWFIYISPHLTDSEYGAGKILDEIAQSSKVNYRDDLHLSVSMRSFRSENVSLLIKQLLDIKVTEARKTLEKIDSKYPIVITRNLEKAKSWLREQARGSERYGILVSSQALRLKPYAVDVRATVDPIHWFLDGKDDIRSSYYLEDVTTEFQIQGLELDWACVMWDGDFRFHTNEWNYHSFCGTKWNNILKIERQNYLRNAYRVLLTRARQGMVIFVPPGDEKDPTRLPKFYNSTYNYLDQIGFKNL